MADSPRMMARLVELFSSSGLDAIIETYLGERPVMAVDKWTLRRVPRDSGTGWHQDGAFLGPQLRTVNVWIALTDCGGDRRPRPPVSTSCPGGSTRSSRRAPRAPCSTPSSAPRWQPEWRAIGPSSGRSSQPGDALVFDDLFLHQTGIVRG